MYSADAVWAIIAGDAAASRLAPLLHGPINLDTLDGIVRAARAFGLRGVRLPERLFHLQDGRPWIRAAAVPVVDRFWALKDRVYCRVINLPSNIVCEARMSEAVARRYDRSIFTGFASFDDDALAELLREHAAESGLTRGRDDAFRLDATPAAGEHLQRSRKRYFIDHSATPDERGLPLDRWARRYRHERQLRFLVPHDPAVQLSLPGLGGGRRSTRRRAAPLVSEEPEI